MLIVRMLTDDEGPHKLNGMTLPNKQRLALVCSNLVVESQIENLSINLVSAADHRLKTSKQYAGSDLSNHTSSSCHSNLVMNATSKAVFDWSIEDITSEQDWT